MKRWLVPGAVVFALVPRPADAKCKITGTVKDADGKPLVGVRVFLEGAKGETTTAADGVYGIKADGDSVRVVLALEDRSGKWWQMLHNRAPLVIRSDAFAPSGDCARDFDAGAPAGSYDKKPLPQADWPAAFALYQGFSRAATFAGRLGIKPGSRPLLVNAWSATAGPNASSWIGPISFNPQGRTRAQVNIGTDASGLADQGHPTNREYHEFGHHALALALGTLPRTRDDLRHGGYYTNPSSADALAEGIATFFAVMVRKHVDGHADAQIRIDGATFDLDQPHRPWDHSTAESLAVAAVLVDLEDGPREANAAAVELVSHSLVDDGTLMIGTLGGDVGDGAPLTVTAGEFVGVTTVVRLADTVWFAVPVPAQTSSDTVAVSTGAPATADDDPLNVAAEDIWRTIVAYRGTKDQGDRHILDVEDLHAALSAKFGAKEIDALFIAHGLFADLNGNKTHDSGEKPGLTSHPSSPNGDAMLPRHRLPLPETLWIAVSTEPAAERFVVHVRASVDRPGYAYVASARDGEIPVAVPTSGKATIIAFGPKHRPSVVGTLEAEAFWTDPASLSSLSAELQAVPPTVSTGTAANGDGGDSNWSFPRGRVPLVMFISGCVCVLAGAAFMLTGRRRVRGDGPRG